MQKWTSRIITKMHWSSLLYSLPPSYWSCCCICCHLSRCSQNPKISTWSRSHEIIIFWSFHCSWKKLLFNLSRINLCCSSLYCHACTYFHHTITCRLYLHTHIFAFKFTSWIIFHLCVFRKDSTFFKSWKTS